MAKIALITDTHWGARNDNVTLNAHMARFYEEIFFPYLDQNEIKHVIHLGDIVDRRKYINYMTARNLRNQFIDPLIDRGIETDIIIGNHDTFFKNTNEVNSMNELYSHMRHPNIRWHSDPTEISVDGTKIMLMPWICSGNYEECMESIRGTEAQILMGHLEIAGFEMYRGSVNDHGFEGKLFDKFDMVMSGHFHHKSTRGNINYLGAPYEMTWSDYDDARGFHVFDTETRELLFIENHLKLHHKIFYNDSGKTLKDIKNMNLDQYAGSYVKVVIQEKQNPYWFDLFIDHLEKVGVIDFKIVDDHLNLDIEDADDIISEAEDTLTIIKKYAASYLADKEPEVLSQLNTLLTDLYSEALSLENEL